MKSILLLTFVLGLCLSCVSEPSRERDPYGGLAVPLKQMDNDKEKKEKP